MMQKISGLGGLFFRAKDPDSLSEWYDKHFGINANSSTTVWQQEAGPTVFAPFPNDTDYFGSDSQSFMLNFRVDDLEAMLQQLKHDGVTIDNERAEEAAGKFAWVYDPEGNKIELWEPAADVDWDTERG